MLGFHKNPNFIQLVHTQHLKINQEKDELKRKLDAAEKDKSNLGEY